MVLHQFALTNYSQNLPIIHSSGARGMTTNKSQEMHENPKPTSTFIRTRVLLSASSNQKIARSRKNYVCPISFNSAIPHFPAARIPSCSSLQLNPLTSPYSCDPSKRIFRSSYIYSSQFLFGTKLVHVAQSRFCLPRDSCVSYLP